ncbi:putative 26S proteasome non-ATPase regulatory subunit 1 B [Paratrimastix pyriformis]|uniref:26S proteasome non-ATPase regulatory subunit 1 B n=1 Tax=Paratrimastix pyriformis TaxID=342808 RepID=A0ABQ8UL47_9EUKA|nr:putative 26S proteasome non-ATPase regulatory subunit 1 B [Paratrimastix pyriformis]
MQVEVAQDPLRNAAFFLPMLDHPSASVKATSLRRLDDMVAHFWPQIADVLPKIKTLAENEQFQDHHLAALLAAKVVFHLNDLATSLKFALLAGDLFDITQSSSFVDTISDKAIDVYKAEQLRLAEGKEDHPAPMDPRLEALFNRKCELALSKGEFHHVMGLAIEGHRLDILERAMQQSGNLRHMLAECHRISLKNVHSRDFRLQIFRLLVQMHSAQTPPDLFEICQLLVSLNDPERVALMFVSEIQKNNKATVLQLAFDLLEAAPQQFIRVIRDRLKALTGSFEGEPGTLGTQVQSVLSGEPLTDLKLRFLFAHNKADPLNMADVKAKVDQRSSLTHAGAVYAHALMYAGTACDSFLRANEEFIARATNFAKMAVTSSIGVVHIGHIKEGMTLLGQFLPASAGAVGAGAATSSPYSEAGALYALGLINANHGGECVPYLLEALNAAAGNPANAPVVQHGAALGLGAAALGTGDLTLFEALKAVLFADNAVSGEAAAYGIGMVMLGTGNAEAVHELLAYAHDTKHEKITRALGLAVALIMCGCEGQADIVIEQMCMDQEALIRYGGMFCAGLAYCGNPNHAILSRLLRVAVSDPSDDVRRASVMAVGFLLSRDPESCPKMLKLTAESFNPHVRYGVALALGVSCAATGNTEAFAMLRHMMEDRVSFVRQAACIGLAMVCMLRNEVQEPKIKDVRAEYFKIMPQKVVEPIVKFGAMLATGIIDAGGRNVTISLHSATGVPRLGAIAGMTLFLQFWYWHPMIHCLALAFEPTAIIAVNSELQMPLFSFKSNNKPSLYAYPEKRVPPPKEEVKKGPAAILSTTAHAQALEEKKKKEREQAKNAAGEGASSMEVLQNPARVTPDQRKDILYDSDPRYKPVRPEKRMGIIVLLDEHAEQPVSLVTETAMKVGDDEPAPPEPFEYP